MVRACIIFFMLPILVSCTGDGNIHLLEEDVAEALRTCSQINNKGNRNKSGSRQRRFDKKNDNTQIIRVDANTKEDVKTYNHTRRNTNAADQIHTLNGSNNDYLGFGAGNDRGKFINTVPRPARRNYNNSVSNYHLFGFQRVKRNELLINRDDNDQCLSQCVFSNLHMVDSKGIPREAEVWNKVQTSLTSEQSRMLLRDQIRACFQELQSESEDDGCSYSNKLQRCLLLRFSDRKISENKNNTSLNN